MRILPRIRYPFSKIILPRLAIALACIMLGLPAAAGALLPPDTVDFVLVTTEELAPEFERLAAFKEEQGLSTSVVTLEWILANVSPGVDLPETIRNFLQEAHAEWGIQYVLLGGDTPLLPPRHAHNTYFPAGGFTEIPADLYFACLDGDWDADGDGIYGEAYVHYLDPGDEADLEPELVLGRAPVNDPAQAATFVDKAIAFASPTTPGAADRALLMGEVLFPWDWEEDDPIILDGGNLCETLLPLFAAADPPWEVSRLYENHTAFPGADDLTKQAALDSMGSGRFRFVHHAGMVLPDSLSVGDEYILPADVAALANGPDWFFLVSWFGPSAAFDSTSMIERMLVNPNGGCAGGIGASRASFPHTAQDYVEAFYTEILQPENPRVGDALVAALAPFLPSTYYNTVDRWMTMVTTLLADPTIPSASVVSDPTAIGQVSPRKTGITVHPCVPNPFNPMTRIRFELRGRGDDAMPVLVTVVDPAGRRVATLLDEALPPGRHEAVWNGRDRTGKLASAGVYFAVVQAGGEMGAVGISLVK